MYFAVCGNCVCALFCRQALSLCDGTHGNILQQSPQFFLSVSGVWLHTTQYTHDTSDHCTVCVHMFTHTHSLSLCVRWLVYSVVCTLTLLTLSTDEWWDCLWVCNTLSECVSLWYSLVHTDKHVCVMSWLMTHVTHLYTHNRLSSNHTQFRNVFGIIFNWICVSQNYFRKHDSLHLKLSK